MGNWAQSLSKITTVIPLWQADEPCSIVAVHGLNPFNKSDHGWNTWRSPPSNDGYLWLRDSLPKTLPTARVMMYTYNSSPVFGSGKGRFIGEASQLLETLFVKRNEDPARPLMLIGHSLGGILIKQALVNAQANRKHKGIIDATFGLVFIGTPHGGSTKSSKIAFGKACVKIIQTVYGHASNDLMKAVEHGSLFSDVLKENWRHQLENYQIVSCYESIDEVNSHPFRVKLWLIRHFRSFLTIQLS